MKELLESVLNGEQENVQLPYATPREILNILEELGAKDNEDLYSNGWQYDFGIGFTFKNEKFIFSGSWFSGGYNFYKVK